MFGQMLAAHLGDSADEQARLYLARIEQGVRGMESLIDDLLTLAQVARAQLVMAPVDLTALCREVIEGLRLARSAAKGRGVTGRWPAVHGRCRVAAPVAGQPAGQCLEIHGPHAEGPDPDRARAGSHRPGGGLFLWRTTAQALT
jgi:signal transduction histidine kinase